MGLDIETKVIGAADTTGKFSVDEINKILDVLNNAIGDFSGEDALKDALGNVSLPKYYLEYNSDESFNIYDLKDYLINNVKTLIDISGTGVKVVNGLFLDKEHNKIKRLYGKALSQLDSVGSFTIEPLKVYTIVLDLDAGKRSFKIVGSVANAALSKTIKSVDLGNDNKLGPITNTFSTEAKPNTIFFSTGTRVPNGIHGLLINRDPFILQLTNSTSNVSSKAVDSGTHIVADGKVEKVLWDKEIYIGTDDNSYNIKNVIIPANLKDNNKRNIPTGEAVKLTIGGRKYLYTTTRKYVERSGVWFYTGDKNLESYKNDGFDFIAGFTSVGVGKIDFTGTVLWIENSVGTMINYTSGADILAGTYQLYGEDITKLTFGRVLH